MLQMKVRALVLTFFQSSPPKEIVTLPARCVAEGNHSPDSVSAKESPLPVFLSWSAFLQCALSAKCQLHVFAGKSASERRWVVSH